MKRLACLAAALLILPLQAEERLPRGDAVVRSPLGDSEIVITTTSRLAGAIHSLTWNGKEFIDSVDHGRQLQSASNLDFGSPMTAETFNPTEAGSRRDSAGSTSSSKLLHLSAEGNRLQTTTQMAFWLAPGEKSGGELAKNTGILSNHLLTKRVQIGYRDLPQVLTYDVTFGLPKDERHQLAQFEVVTGYMPAEFRNFWQFQPNTGELEPLSDGPGEQPLPVVLATESGGHAMGCFTPEKPASPGWTGPGYGRFRFVPEQVVKWNCVFRLRKEQGVPAVDYDFRVFVIVGDLPMVQDALRQLHKEFSR